MAKHEVVFCIVNAGFSEAVMESAREAGATGGTVLHASGTANPQAERFFGLSIEPNKEMVMILIDTKIKEKVLHNLYQDVGLKTACQGIAFTLPVGEVVGLTPPPTPKSEESVATTAQQSAKEHQPATEEQPSNKENKIGE